LAKSTASKTGLFIAFALFYISLTSLAAQEVPPYLEDLVDVYGSSFTIVDQNTIRWNDGEISVLDDGKEKTVEEMLVSADIEDQFFMPYRTGPLDPPASALEDPGRIRNDGFFKKLYGSTPEEVESNLVPLEWMPCHTDTVLLFNKRHGAYESLKRVSDELEQLDEELLKYVTETAGTYSWRVIKDTERLSVHSFGIAIDINVSYSAYWKWDSEYRYRNSIPYEIVRIFEKNGFIWGGKWYHYDTMHFEYRPELL